VHFGSGVVDLRERVDQYHGIIGGGRVFGGLRTIEDIIVAAFGEGSVLSPSLHLPLSSSNVRVGGEAHELVPILQTMEEFEVYFTLMVDIGHVVVI
jgi:hypothetical protein